MIREDLVVPKFIKIGHLQEELAKEEVTIIEIII
jgi:hypothetical protein